jgi:diaminopimelate decarboxylase
MRWRGVAGRRSGVRPGGVHHPGLRGGHAHAQPDDDADPRPRDDHPPATIIDGEDIRVGGCSLTAIGKDFGTPVPAIDLHGLHVHIGSQILNPEEFEDGVAVLAKLERFGVYDLGGGLGVRYAHDDKAPSIGEYAKRLTGALHKKIGEDIELLVEPGRSLVAPAK